MQNSGLGNIINPLLSLADPDVFSIPMILLIGWRGEPGIEDEPQHIKQGRVTTDLLNTMKIPYEVLSSKTTSEEADQIVKKMVKQASTSNTPCALLVKKGTFKSYKLKLDKYYDERRSGQYWEPHNMKWIKNGLQREISLVTSGNREKIRVSLLEDNVYQGAKDILLDSNRYYDIFEPNPHTAETHTQPE